jgi:hypothetical protein
LSRGRGGVPPPDFTEILEYIYKFKTQLNYYALELAGAANLAGKTIIDAANPIADAAPENGVLKFFTDINYSLMEQLQPAFPGANFVKAFNSIGSPFMIIVRYLWNALLVLVVYLGY